MRVAAGRPESSRGGFEVCEARRLYIQRTCKYFGSLRDETGRRARFATAWLVTQPSGSDPRRRDHFTIGRQMTKRRSKPKRKTGKRGPKEERLVITDDPQAALAKLLRKKPS